MEKLYLSGVKLQRALEFLRIIEDLKNDKDFVIAGGGPSRIEVIEVEDMETNMIETGKTYIGYLGNAVFFEYKENVYFIKSSILKDNTIEWEVTGYAIVNKKRAMQATYPSKFEGLEAIKNSYIKYEKALF